MHSFYKKNYEAFRHIFGGFRRCNWVSYTRPYHVENTYLEAMVNAFGFHLILVESLLSVQNREQKPFYFKTEHKLQTPIKQRIFWHMHFA